MRFMGGKEFATPEEVVFEKYTAIRLTLERFVNSGRLQEFKIYMFEDEGRLYLCDKKFPKYVLFTKKRARLSQDKKDSWWEAYDFIKIALRDFSHSQNDSDFMAWVQKELVKKMNIFILYISKLRKSSVDDNNIGYHLDYEDMKIILKKSGNLVDFVDFSNCPKSRPYFETFNYFRLIGQTKISPEQLIDRYKKLFDKTVVWGEFTLKVSTVMKMINKKELIRKRINWYFDKRRQEYIFEFV